MRIFISIIFLIPLITLAQEKEETIQKIRDRYYRINSGEIDLQEIDYSGSKYFLENGKISIIKHQTDSGRFEYYFDTRSNKYFNYFIYFDSKDKTTSNPDIRAYYDNRSDLISLKINQQELEFNPYNHQYYYLELIANNSLNKLLNLFELVKYKDDMRHVEILKKTEELDNTISRVDTVQIVEYENESITKLEFKNSYGKIIKSQLFDGSEHYGKIAVEYFDSGRLIMSIVEDEGWMGNFTGASITFTYFEYEKPFRTDSYYSYGVHPGYNSDDEGGLEFSTSKMIPKIEYFNCADD